MFAEIVPGLIKILAGIGALLFLVVSVSKARLHQRDRRGKALQLFARDSGMTYQENLLELEQLLKPFQLIQKKNAEIKIRNVITSRSGELTLFLFDYSWESEGGDEFQHQSVMLFDDFRFQLAHFLLRPRRLGDFLESVTDKRDVVPEGNKMFNKKFRLTSQSPRETYYLFTEQLMQFFLQHEKLNAEGVDTFFLLYEPGVLIEPDKMQPFLEDKIKGYRELKNAAS